MNTLVPKITLALAIAIGSISCQNENLVNPGQPAAAARQGADEIISPNPPQAPRLTKYGNSVLSYLPNGHLQKVTTFVARGGVDYHTDYTYAPGSIRAASYQGSVLVRDETFTLDASGRCTESVVKGVPTDTHWIYTYNAKGQLWGCQKKNTPVGGTSYTYDAAGDLIKASVATSVSDGMELTFSYVLPMNPNYYSYDTYPLNLNVPMLPEHDTFLRIFGKTGPHLVKSVSYSPLGSVIVPTPGTRFYGYDIISDGSIVERDMAYTFGGKPVEKLVYQYELADLKVN